MKISEINKYNIIIKKIMDEPNIKLDISTRFQFLTLLKQFEPTMEMMDSLRNEKIMEYGEQSADGNYTIPITNTNAVEKFKTDMDKLSDTDVALVINKLKFKDLVNSGIPSDYLLALYDIIEPEV